MAIGEGPISSAPIAASPDDAGVSIQTIQFASIVSVTTSVPAQTIQLAGIVSVSSIVPAQTIQYAIIISVTKRKSHPFHNAVRVAQASPLYAIFDAPTNNPPGF